jgi:hypothetical protein
MPSSVRIRDSSERHAYIGEGSMLVTVQVQRYLMALIALERESIDSSSPKHAIERGACLTFISDLLLEQIQPVFPYLEVLGVKAKHQKMVNGETGSSYDSLTSRGDQPRRR